MEQSRDACHKTKGTARNKTRGTPSAAFEHESSKMERACEGEKKGSNRTSEIHASKHWGLASQLLPTQQNGAYLWSRAVAIVAAIAIVAAVEPVAD